MKDKRVLAGVAVLLLAAFWFYIKPNYLDAKPPPPPPTEEQIAAAARPTVFLGKSNAAAGHGAAPAPVEALVLNLKAPAYALLSMGMMMLPPVIVSLPFKILLFVLVDGWYLIIGSLVGSFN